MIHIAGLFQLNPFGILNSIKLIQKGAEKNLIQNTIPFFNIKILFLL